MISIQNFKYIYLILLVGGGTFQVCLKMLLEHFNHNAAIYNIFLCVWLIPVHKQ